MTEIADTAGPDKVASAEQIGLSAREAAAPPPRDAAEAALLDSKRQWRHARNVWHNSMVRSVLQTIAAPVTGLRRALKS
jgi:hypothetical protein